MIVVSNTTPLIGLSSIQRFQLLQQIFGRIYIAQAVYDETYVSGQKKGRAKQKVPIPNWIETVRVKDRLAVEVLLDELDLGEAETIVLAREMNADWILMDEKKGRRKLNQLGIQKIGTIGILLKAKERGLLSMVQPDLELLRKKSFIISQNVIDAVLKQANE